MPIEVLMPSMAALLGTLILILYRGHEARITSAEGLIRALELANTNFKPLAKAVEDFRIEMQNDLTAIRTENKERRDEMRTEVSNFRTESTGRLDKLSGEVAATSGKLSELTGMLANPPQSQRRKSR